MRNALLLIGVVGMVCLAQDSIPYPPGIPTGNYIFWVESIGDYDGDGFGDVAMLWNNGISAPVTYDYLCIYSYAKGSFLLQVPVASYMRTCFSFADLNKDGKIEVVAVNVIYHYSLTMSKKKVF
jgi:hypothetical protein